MRERETGSIYGRLTQEKELWFSKSEIGSKFYYISIKHI